MRVRGQVRYDLVGRDAHTDGFADGFAGDFAGDHIGVADLEAGEELQNGDLQVGGGVGVDAVVGFDDDEAGGVGGGSRG